MNIYANMSEVEREERSEISIRYLASITNDTLSNKIRQKRVSNPFPKQTKKLDENFQRINQKEEATDNSSPVSWFCL